MGKWTEHRRWMARFRVKVLKGKGELGEALECEPPDKAGRKIQALLRDAANNIADEDRQDDGDSESKDGAR